MPPRAETLLHTRYPNCSLVRRISKQGSWIIWANSCRRMLLNVSSGPTWYRTVMQELLWTLFFTSRKLKAKIAACNYLAILKKRTITQWIILPVSCAYGAFSLQILLFSQEIWPFLLEIWPFELKTWPEIPAIWLLLFEIWPLLLWDLTNFNLKHGRFWLEMGRKEAK